MRKHWRKILLGLVVVAVLVGSFFGVYSFGRDSVVIPEPPEPETIIVTPEDVGKFAALTEVYKLVKERFFFSLPPDEEMVGGAIKGMLETLDEENTHYFDPKLAKFYQSESEGSFAGIGVNTTIANDQHVITFVMPNTPAEEAGVQAGDIVTHVDGKSVKGILSIEFISLVRGEEGTKVTLTVYRPGVGDLDIEITRGIIETKELYTQLLGEGRIGYMWLTGFSRDASDQVREALQQFIEKDKVGALILDLRGNPGGNLWTAITILSHFLPGQKIAVYYLSKDPTTGEVIEVPYATAPGGLATEIPLVVLIDHGSASASDLVVAALKDHRDIRPVTLIGVTTLGKGVGQNSYPLSDGGRVSITSFEFLSPKKHKIHGVGVQPDEGFFEPTTPYQRRRGQDPALDRAVEELLEQLDSITP